MSTTRIRPPTAEALEYARLWNTVFNTNPDNFYPVDVERLIFEVINRKFPDQPIVQVVGGDLGSLEGTLKLVGNDWHLVYNNRISNSGRINFTIAHELGHYICHRHFYSEFKCDSQSLRGIDATQSKNIEKEADSFASFLLIPIQDFREQAGDERPDIRLLSKFADRYRISFTAAALKYMAFTSRKAALVISRDGFVSWSWPSDAARRDGIFYNKGMEVPAGSLNQNCFDNGNSESNENGRLLSAGVWHPSANCWETSFVSDQHEYVYSILDF